MSSGRRSVCSPPDVGRKMAARDNGKRKLHELEVVGGKVSARGQLANVVNDVSKGLGKKNLELFSKSCFGHLLDVPRIQPQMQVVFLMLNSLQLSSDKKDVLSFMINGKTVELGPQEFYCISGLSFKEGCRMPTSSKIHRDIFRGDMNLRATDIQQAFKNYCVKHDGTGSLVLKLAFLHVIYGLLLNRDQQWKKIDIEYMHIVDDIATFNKYPWGRVAYDFLVYWTHRARMNVDRLTVNSDRPSTDICGFYITLQIFAYEVMPMLARHCARRLEGMAFPRICRWTASSFFKYTALVPYFQSSDDNTIMHMSFTDNESARLREAGLSDLNGAQRLLGASERNRMKNIDLNIVDMDGSNEFNDEEMEPLKQAGQLVAGNQVNTDKACADRGKAKVDEEVQEVAITKVFESSSGRRARREKYSKLGELLKDPTVTSSLRGSKPQQGMSLEKLGEMMLDIKATVFKQGECMNRLGDVILGMNSRLDTVVSRLSEIDKSVAMERGSAIGIGRVGDDSGLLTKDGPREADAKDGNAVSPHLKAVDVGENVYGDDGACDRFAEGVSGVGIEQPVCSTSQITGKKEKGSGSVVEGEDQAGDHLVRKDMKAAQQLLQEGAREGGDCHRTNVEPDIHSSNSQEFELSDIEAYEPEPAKESTHQSAKKRLFDEAMETTGPVYGVITGEPLKKKQKTTGKRKTTKPVKLISLSLESFVPNREYHLDFEKSFTDWYNKYKNVKDGSLLKLPTQCKTEADASWFESIYSANGWLTDEHCDVLLNLLIIHSMKYPDDFQDNWTVIENMATQTLMLESMHASPERILPYVEGEYPHQGGKAWYDVEVVYGVGNVGKDHWVLLAIDLNEQRLIVYDSLSARHAKWDDIKSTFVNVCSNVPRLIEMLDVYRNKDVKPVLKPVWDMVRYEHPPQQQNLSDCGILCLKSLECLVTGQPFSAFDPMRCSLYRKGYCLELFSKGEVIDEADGI